MSLQSNQLKFIASPVSSILREAVVASAAVGSGIESYPINNYIMHSTFLKMAGAQEQKMKCLVWELASNDYEYRYFRYSQKPYGECSCYEEKNKIYRDLIDQIVKLDPIFDIEIYLNKTDILTSIKTEIEDIFKDSSLVKIHSRRYHEWLKIISNYKAECFAVGVQPATQKNDERRIFSICDKCNFNGKKAGSLHCSNQKNLFETYELLYRHRNRCAHNTTSYQQNLPVFSTLLNIDYPYENYFLYFSILIMIDKVFMQLFHKYREVIEMSIN